MGKFRNAITKARNLYEQWKMRRKLRCTDFSIISNNCWAGTAVYQPFGLKYNTPTVGLFIMDEDYIRFIENLKWYLNQSLQFIEPRESKFYDKISKGGPATISYPIATIGSDVEIHFLHYHSKEEAENKWLRRVKRVNFDRLLVKMSLRDSGYDKTAMLDRFCGLPYKNKLCFSPVDYPSSEVIYVPDLETLNLVGGDETESTLKYIDITKVLNSIE